MVMHAFQLEKFDRIRFCIGSFFEIFDQASFDGIQDGDLIHVRNKGHNETPVESIDSKILTSPESAIEEEQAALALTQLFFKGCDSNFSASAAARH